MHFLKGKKCIFFSRWLLGRWNNRVIKQGQISFNQYSTGKYIQHFMTIMCSTWLNRNAKKKKKNQPNKQTKQNKKNKNKKNNRKLLQAQSFKAFFPGVSYWWLSNFAWLHNSYIHSSTTFGDMLQTMIILFSTDWTMAGMKTLLIIFVIMFPVAMTTQEDVNHGGNN